MSDNISSIVVDNSFLSTNDQPLEINGLYYVSKEQYIIDQISENWKDGRIIIPKPVSPDSNLLEPSGDDDNDFILSVAKLYPRNSTVVSWFGARLPKTSILGRKDKMKYDDYNVNELRTNYLSDHDYTVSENSIIIFAQGNKDLTPDLTSPVIVTVLRPKTEENKKPQIEKKKTPLKIFIIKDPKNKLHM